MTTIPVPQFCHRKNALEWSVFGLSLAIVAGVIGMLIYQALTVGEEPARLTVEMGEPLASHRQIRLPLRVINEGDLPAIRVEVEVTGMLEGKETASTVTFDYIAHRTQREGWVSFPGEVVPAALEARVLGYTDQ